MVNPGFWSKLKSLNSAESEQNRAILCLAPMADVTDAAFRYVISKNSKIPYVTYTEFTSADGLVLAPEAGRKKLLKNLEYSEIERPIVAQFFTSKPEMMEKVSELAVELGFDGIDINMGCPDKSIEKQGAGAALIKNPQLAREIILSAKKGSENASKKLGKNPCPVSVKTRLGYNRDELEEWLPELLAEEPAVITVHARTRKEMSKVPARWERVKAAVEIRNEIQDLSKSHTLIFGNGDVKNIKEAYKLTDETRCDGVMLGRAIFGNPFLFSKHVPTTEEKIKALIEHIEIFVMKFSGIKNLAIMKKHFKSYLSGIPNSSVLLKELMETNDAKSMETYLRGFIRKT